MALISDKVMKAIGTLVETAGAPDVSADGILALSHLFTKNRQEIDKRYLDDPALLSAYLQYFLPVNLAKIRCILEELPRDGTRRQEDRPLQVLDVGAGPGTASLAVLEWWLDHGRNPSELKVIALDHSRSALSVARRLWQVVAETRQATGATFDVHLVDLERQTEVQRALAACAGQTDLILVGNVLNESFANDRDPVGRRVKVIAPLLQHLVDVGSLIIVEPALREPTRALHALRDRVVGAGLATVYSPCLHDHACPALLHPEDWCHEERHWQPPASVVAMDREVGFIKDALKFSYLVLRKDGRTIVPRGPNLIRVVSEQRRFKGELRVWGCGETGRREIGRLDRERAETNAGFDQGDRGTIVRIEGSQRREGSGLERIPAEATIQIVRTLQITADEG